MKSKKVYLGLVCDVCHEPLSMLGNGNYVCGENRCNAYGEEVIIENECDRIGDKNIGGTSSEDNL